jgi:hypothetical protein
MGDLKMYRIRSAAVALAGLWSALSFADAVSDTLPASVRACMAERDDARRLACFDRETARLTDSPAASGPSASSAAATPVAATAAASAAPPAPSDEQKFGYRGNLARADVDKRKAQDQQIEQVTAKVVEVSARPHGQFVVKLDNGQAWEQKMAERSVRLKVGDEVTIRRASFGSFMLVTPTGKSTRVARVE